MYLPCRSILSSRQQTASPRFAQRDLSFLCNQSSFIFLSCNIVAHQLYKYSVLSPRNLTQRLLGCCRLVAEDIFVCDI